MISPGITFWLIIFNILINFKAVDSKIKVSSEECSQKIDKTRKEIEEFSNWMVKFNLILFLK